MSDNPYPVEVLDDYDDDGTMPENVAALSSHVVGRKIVKVEKDVLSAPDRWGYQGIATALTLDNGKSVFLRSGGDCCAYTDLEDITLNLDRIDHVITGIGTTDGYETWHIYADLGDVVEMKVGWSCGNPFYYGYGFDITVTDAPAEESK